MRRGQVKRREPSGPEPTIPKRAPDRHNAIVTNHQSGQA
jgi:hypothetical protein